MAGRVAVVWMRYHSTDLHLLAVVRVRVASRNAQLYRPVVQVAMRRAVGGHVDDMRGDKHLR